MDIFFLNLKLTYYATYIYIKIFFDTEMKFLLNFNLIQLFITIFMYISS